MTLQVDIHQGRVPPPFPDGISIVIDVIRAFTTSYYAFERGVVRILLAGSTDEAFALRTRFPDALLAGEKQALPIDGFDYGNSPYEMQHAELDGRDLILLTTNGVAALLRCESSLASYACGFATARATANHVRQQCQREGIHKVQIIASHPTGDEDMACAEYIRSILQAQPGTTPEEVIDRIYHCQAAPKFMNGSHPRLRPDDIHMAATELTQPKFVMQCSYQGQPTLHKVALDNNALELTS